MQTKYKITFSILLIILLFILLLIPVLSFAWEWAWQPAVNDSDYVWVIGDTCYAWQTGEFNLDKSYPIAPPPLRVGRSYNQWNDLLRQIWIEGTTDTLIQRRRPTNYECWK